MKKGKNGYYAVKPSKPMAEKIHKIMKLIGVNNLIEAKDLHCTVIYSSDGHQYNALDSGGFTSLETFRAYLDLDQPFKVMGKLGDKWSSIALNFKSPELEKLHHRLNDFIFPSKHDYEDYDVHMSVAYNPDPELVEFLLTLKGTDLGREGIDLVVLGDLYCEDLNEG